MQAPRHASGRQSVTVASNDDAATAARPTGNGHQHTRGRKVDPHRGALAWAAFDRELAAMHRDQLAADRQPEPGSPIIAADRGVGLGEGLAKRCQRRGIDPDAGIRHHQHHIAIRRPTAMDRDRAPGRRELHRIGQQVQHDLPHRATIGAQHHRALHDAAFQTKLLGLRLQPHHGQTGTHRGTQVNPILRQRVTACLDPCQFQHLVDDVQQVSPTGHDVGCPLDCGIGHASGPGLLHQLREADDRVQRGAQFMAHIRQELRFGPARCLGRFLRTPQFVGCLYFRRYVARRAVIAGEDAGIIEHRHAARTDVVHPSVRVAQQIAELPKRLALHEIGPMCCWPWRIGAVGSGKLPSCGTDVAARLVSAQQRCRGQPQESQIGVLLPEPIR